MTHDDHNRDFAATDKKGDTREAADGEARTATGGPVTATTAMNPAAGAAPSRPAQIVDDGKGGKITVDAAGQAVNQDADGNPQSVNQPIVDADRDRRQHHKHPDHPGATGGPESPAD